MTNSDEILELVVEQLKIKVTSGDIACAKCHASIGGKDLTSIDIERRRIEYRCPNSDCYNASRNGVRTFRGLKILLPATNIPEDLAALEAPAPLPAEMVSFDNDDGFVDDFDEEDDDIGIASGNESIINDPDTEM